MKPNADPKRSRRAAIVNPLGLHARCAAKIAKVAQLAKHKVWISFDGERVDAASVIDILTLGCQKGAVISVTVESTADAVILQQIIDLVESGFGE